MAYKVMRNCSDGVIGNLHRPGDIIDGHPQIGMLLEKGTVIPVVEEPEVVEASDEAPTPKRGRPKKDPLEGEAGDEPTGSEPDPLEI